ncbi:hypothetical protein WJX73_008149 [Symbiochloris irregularis]|uniref:Uncharacterized protein n=1 Tax=Symbiochloris irregularis TaxID=706552 RepID=A0AAW1PYE1_9CHLO
MVKLSWHSTAFDVVEASGVSLAGKTAIVTGGNTGCGLETSKALAKAGARVIFTTRSDSRGTDASRQIRAAVPDANIVTKLLDLADLQSVRAFSQDILSTEGRIDILVCNAGVMFCPQEYTAAGFELQIGTNHFGHFALVQQLLGKMQKQAFPSRIVIVASLAYVAGSINLEDLHYRHRSYSRFTAYWQSKLANCLFAKELARRVPDHMTVLSLHPGTCMTDLARHLLNPGGIFDIRRFWIARSLLNIFMKRADQGAATSVYAAIWPGLEAHSGGYLSDCKITPLQPHACDLDMAARLWHTTEEQLANAYSKPGAH